jgi:DNA-binding NarL/FixJ family response regulator
MSSAIGGHRAPVIGDRIDNPFDVTAMVKGTDRREYERNGDGCLLVLDVRALDRECLTKALISRGLDKEVVPVGSVDEWKREKDAHPPIDAILVNIGGRRANDPSVISDMARLQGEFNAVPIVVLSDYDDLTQVLEMLELGARGFIPSSVGVAVCIGAIGLAIAGGIFVPATTVQAMRHLVGQQQNIAVRPLGGMFTARQEEVVEALRRGKANKIIAYELNLRESTVKVHIRNIMKKLKATNRTEVAYKLNDLFTNVANHHPV